MGFLFEFFKYNNKKSIFSFIIIFISFSFFILVKAIDNKFLKMIKLSNGEYFIIFENLINIYSSNFLNYSTISDTITINIKNIKNISISEYIYEKEIYVLFLIDKSLYIYDYTKKSLNNFLLRELTDLKYDIEGYYFNFIPYKNNDGNIYFIISLIYDHQISFYYYKIISFQKVEYQFFEYYAIKVWKDISPPELSCHILNLSSLFLECFFYRKWQTIFSSVKFNLEAPKKTYDLQDNKEKRNYILFPSEKDKYYINQIKSAVSYNYEKTLVCTSDKVYNSFCLTNNNEVGKFEDVPCSNIQNCYDLDTYFFNETSQFILICKSNIDELNMLIFNYFSEGNYLSSNCKIKNFQINNCKSLNQFSFIYNTSTQNYNIIFDSNFTNITTCSFSSKEENTTDKKESEPIFEYDYDFNQYKNISKEELNDILKEIIPNIEIGENNEIRGKDFTLKIYPTNSTENNNSTHVDFKECEKILRNHYNISNSSFLTFILLELDNANEKSFINQVEYLTLNDNNEVLNLSFCKNVSITVHYGIKEGVNLDKERISSFNNSGVDIFNIKDPFFNNICNAYSESNNDVILEDRRKYIYQQYSLCDQECSRNNIDLEKMIISCNCSVKENINTEIIQPKFEEKESSMLDSNIGVAKCYNLVFSFENKLKNIGFWIFLVLIIINIIFLILYFIKGIKSVLEYVFNEMIQYGYLSKSDKMFFEDKNSTKDNNISEKEMKKEASKKKIKKSRSKSISNPIKIRKKNIDVNQKNQNGIKIRKSKKRKSNARKKDINQKIDDYSNSLNKIKISSNEFINEKKNSLGRIEIKKFKSKKLVKKFNFRTTEDNQDNTKIDNSKIDASNFSLIKIDLNNIQNYSPKDSFQTLHNYTFDEAIKYDRRSIFKIFYIYLLSKQIIFHTFFQNNPLELFYLRFCLFIFLLSSDLALNSLLYLNDNISKKYKYACSLFLFTFSNNFTIIILSTFLSFILITLISKLSNSTNAIRKVFRNEEEKIKLNKKYKITKERKKEIFSEIEKILKFCKIKIILLFIIEILLILFYWYFVTAFCHVYLNTQISWLLDSFLSFLSRFIIELLFALLFSKLYIISIESNCSSLYKALLFIYDFS